nr:ATP synthase subunit I [Schlegelella koreensis]
MKVALPRPTSDAVSRGARPGAFDDEVEDAPVHRLTRDEAADLRRRMPGLSPWRVVVLQAVVALGLGALGWLVASEGVGASLLYGGATVAVPGALMARGMTSRLSSISPVASTLSVLAWSGIKIAVSVGMLMLAPRVVADLSWPALLAGLVICMQTYWVALFWRAR